MRSSTIIPQEPTASLYQFMAALRDPKEDNFDEDITKEIIEETSHEEITEIVGTISDFVTKTVNNSASKNDNHPESSVLVSVNYTESDHSNRKNLFEDIIIDYCLEKHYQFDEFINIDCVTESALNNYFKEFNCVQEIPVTDCASKTPLSDFILETPEDNLFEEITVSDPIKIIITESFFDKIKKEDLFEQIAVEKISAEVRLKENNKDDYLEQINVEEISAEPQFEEIKEADYPEQIEVDTCVEQLTVVDDRIEQKFQDYWGEILLVQIKEELSEQISSDENTTESFDVITDSFEEVSNINSIEHIENTFKQREYETLSGIQSYDSDFAETITLKSQSENIKIVPSIGITKEEVNDILDQVVTDIYERQISEEHTVISVLDEEVNDSLTEQISSDSLKQEVNSSLENQSREKQLTNLEVTAIEEKVSSALDPEIVRGLEEVRGIVEKQVFSVLGEKVTGFEEEVSEIEEAATVISEAENCQKVTANCDSIGDNGTENCFKPVIKKLAEDKITLVYLVDTGIQNQLKAENKENKTEDINFSESENIIKYSNQEIDNTLSQEDYEVINNQIYKQNNIGESEDSNRVCEYLQQENYQETVAENICEEADKQNIVKFEENILSQVQESIEKVVNLVHGDIIKQPNYITPKGNIREYFKNNTSRKNLIRSKDTGKEVYQNYQKPEEVIISNLKDTFTAVNNNQDSENIKEVTCNTYDQIPENCILKEIKNTTTERFIEGIEEPIVNKVTNCIIENIIETEKNLPTQNTVFAEQIPTVKEDINEGTFEIIKQVNQNNVIVKEHFLRENQIKQRSQNIFLNKDNIFRYIDEEFIKKITLNGNIEVDIKNSLISDIEQEVVIKVKLNRSLIDNNNQGVCKYIEHVSNKENKSIEDNTSENHQRNLKLKPITYLNNNLEETLEEDINSIKECTFENNNNNLKQEVITELNNNFEKTLKKEINNIEEVTSENNNKNLKQESITQLNNNFEKNLEGEINNIEKRTSENNNKKLTEESTTELNSNLEKALEEEINNNIKNIFVKSIEDIFKRKEKEIVASVENIVKIYEDETFFTVETKRSIENDTRKKIKESIKQETFVKENSKQGNNTEQENKVNENIEETLNKEESDKNIIDCVEENTCSNTTVNFEVDTTDLFSVILDNHKVKGNETVKDIANKVIEIIETYINTQIGTNNKEEPGQSVSTNTELIVIMSDKVGDAAPAVGDAAPAAGEVAPAAPSPTPDSKTLEANFKNFAKFGDPKSDGKYITLSNSDKWMKQAKIIDGKKITTTDTGIYFKKLKSQKVTLLQYKTFLEDLAKAKKIEVQDIVKKLESCGQPGLHGVGVLRLNKKTSSSLLRPYIVKYNVKSTETVNRLTDHSKYTGTHKQRFDETGKGKGIAGRKDVADTSGYVTGYQNKDSFDSAKQ